MASSLNKRRTATLLGSILTALSSGTNYAYSAYAPQLASRLHITYTQLNIIGISGNMGMSITGPIIGRIVDKRGPKPLLIAAFLFLLLGYSGLWRYYNAGPLTDDHLPLSTLIILSLFAYMNHALSNWLFPGDTSSFLLFLALGTSLPVIVGFFTIRPINSSTEHGNGGTHADGDLSSSSHLLSDPADEDGVAERSYGTAEAVAEAVSGVDIPHATERRRSVELSPAPGRSPNEYRRSHSRHPPPYELIDVHGKKLLKSWEFWLLFSMLVSLSGTGLMFINNVGSIAQALSAKGNPDYDRVEAGKLQAAQVSLISLANCAARIGVGTAADVVKTRFGGHRSYLLIVVSLLFISSQVIASHVEDTKHLWNASLVLGLGYGGIFGLLPTVTLEWFGIGHFSENWGFVGLASLIGGNVFGILFGRDFDSHVIVPTSTTTSSNSTWTRSILTSLSHIRGGVEEPVKRLCLKGRACYVGTLRLTTAACTVSLLLSFVAAWRDRRKYGRRFESNSGYERLDASNDQIALAS